MTIKQKIKKWHIVVLIILGIGGYWLSQNMWVFEKQIPVEVYEEFLNGTKWELIKPKSESVTILREFNSSKTYDEYCIGFCTNIFKTYFNWNIKGDELYVEFKNNDVLIIPIEREFEKSIEEHKILKLTEKHLVTKLRYNKNNIQSTLRILVFEKQ